MTELIDDNLPNQTQEKSGSIDASSLQVMQIGLDDGYAFTKIALPDGRLLAITSPGGSSL